MRAVTFQAPGVIEVSDVAEPELLDATDAIVRGEASGSCGSDLHIFHGRVRIEPGFTIGHEYVGTVVAVGDRVKRVAVGERVLGCFQTACGECWFCRRGQVNLCDRRQVLGVSCNEYRRHGAFADYVAVPERIVYRLPDGVSFAEAASLPVAYGTAHRMLITHNTVKKGDRVLISKYGGTEIKIDGENYLIMREDDILGIIG